jgi:hypothetical protein
MTPSLRVDQREPFARCAPVATLRLGEERRNHRPLAERPRLLELRLELGLTPKESVPRRARQADGGSGGDDVVPASDEREEPLDLRRPRRP